MAQLCLHYSGGGGGGNTTFGGFVFGTSGNVIKAKSAPSPQSPVKIIYSATQTYGEISGKVQQLFKDKPHHGLLIELYGTVQLGSDPELQLTLTSSQSQALATCVLAQGASPEVPITTKAYQKFPFVLRFPPNFPLPPSFASQGGKVNYKVVVSMRVHKKLKLLHELPLHYVGDHKISELSSIGALKHLVLDVEASPATPRVCTLEKGNCTTTLTMEKSEFMINEDLPFKFEVKFGSEGTSGTSIKLKLITITLLRRIRTSAKGRRDQESTEILEVVTFKRFLNRGQISRSGSLKLGSIPGLTTTFGGHYGKVRLGIEYGIGIKVVAKDGEKMEGELNIGLGTREGAPSPTAPEEGVDPSAPEEEREEEEETPSAPPELEATPRRPRFAKWSLVACSMLSLLPPSYSQLPSRSGSLESLETLPPHYDDLEENEKDQD